MNFLQNSIAFLYVAHLDLWETGLVSSNQYSRYFFPQWSFSLSNWKRYRWTWCPSVMVKWLAKGHNFWRRRKRQRSSVDFFLFIISCWGIFFFWIEFSWDFSCLLNKQHFNEKSCKSSLYFMKIFSYRAFNILNPCVYNQLFCFCLWNLSQMTQIVFISNQKYAAWINAMAVS